MRARFSFYRPVKKGVGREPRGGHQRPARVLRRFTPEAGSGQGRTGPGWPADSKSSRVPMAGTKIIARKTFLPGCSTPRPPEGVHGINVTDTDWEAISIPGRENFHDPGYDPR